MNLQIFDFVCMFMTLLALVIIPRSYRGWLLYSFSCLCYLYVRVISGMYSSAFLELIAIGIGLYNFNRLKSKV